MTVSMSEFLDKVSNLSNRAQKVEALRFNNSFALRTTLQGFFDPRIQFALPEGNPPFKVNELHDQEAVYLKECRKLQYLVESDLYKNMPQGKREGIFIGLLEMVCKQDAQMLLAMKEKKNPFKGITADIVREALPGLLPDEQKQEATI